MTLESNLNADSNELQLIQAAKQGNLQAFDQLVLRYQDKIYSTIFRLVAHQEDAFDLTQEVFLRAYRFLGGFQQNSSFYTWLFRIALNVAINFQRKKKDFYSLHANTEDGKEPQNPNKRQPTPSFYLEQKEVYTKIYQAIAQLKDEFRIPLILRDIEGLEYEEISNLLSVPKGTVKSRIHRAREQLKEKLKDVIP